VNDVEIVAVQAAGKGRGGGTDRLPAGTTVVEWRASVAAPQVDLVTQNEVCTQVIADEVELGGCLNDPGGRRCTTALGEPAGHRDARRGRDGTCRPLLVDGKQTQRGHIANCPAGRCPHRAALPGDDL